MQVAGGEAALGPDLDCREVNGGQDIPVGLEKGLPRRQSPAVRRRLDAVGLEDVGDRRVRYAVPQIRQHPLNPVIAPARTLLGDPKHQLDNLRRDRGTSSGFPAIAMVPMPGDQLAMPPKNRIRSHDGGQLLEHLAPEDLAFDGQAPALVVVKEDSPLPELLSEHAILGLKVLDDFLLSLIDPACQDQEQQLPGFQRSPHISPNVV